MAIPNLLHPVPVAIQQKDSQATLVDDNFKEPIQQAARLANVSCPGQVKWYTDEELLAGHGGIQADSEGYVLFRYVDLAALGITLKLNDRFTRLGSVETDLYIVSMKHEGHWQDQGGPTLLKAFFRDRTPSRQNRGSL